MTYRVYTAELRQFGAPAIIIVTAGRLQTRFSTQSGSQSKERSLLASPSVVTRETIPIFPLNRKTTWWWKPYDARESISRVNGICYRSTCVRRRRRKGTRCFWRKRGYGVVLLHLRKLPLKPDAMNYARSSTELSDYRLLLALMKRFTSSNKLTGCQAAHQRRGAADRGERSEAAVAVAAVIAH